MTQLTASQSELNSNELFNMLLAIKTVRFSLDTVFIGVDIGSSILKQVPRCRVCECEECRLDCDNHDYDKCHLSVRSPLRVTAALLPEIKYLS